MKDLKEFILEKRIRELKVDGKKVPDKYIAVFNDYLVEIAELIKVHDRELVKEVCEKIKRNVRVTRIKKKWFAFEDDLRNILDQIQKEIENENNED